MPKGKINMKNISIKTLLVLTLVTTLVDAKELAKTITPVIKSQKQNLVDMAGKQRMLSQRIIKDYLYKGRKVATAKASKQLSPSVTEFSTALKTLNSSLNDEEIKNLLEFVEMSFNDFKEITEQPFDLDNAQIALDLSESLLEGSQFVVDSIKSSSSISKD